MKLRHLSIILIFFSCPQLFSALSITESPRLISLLESATFLPSALCYLVSAYYSSELTYKLEFDIAEFCTSSHRREHRSIKYPATRIEFDSLSNCVYLWTNRITRAGYAYAQDVMRLWQIEFHEFPISGSAVDALKEQLSAYACIKVPALEDLYTLNYASQRRMCSGAQFMSQMHYPCLPNDSMSSEKYTAKHDVSHKKGSDQYIFKLFITAKENNASYYSVEWNPQQGPSAQPLRALLSPCGKYAFAATDKGGIVAISLETGMNVGQIETQDGVTALYAGYHNNESLLIAGLSDGSVKGWFYTFK